MLRLERKFERNWGDMAKNDLVEECILALMLAVFMTK